MSFANKTVLLIGSEGSMGIRYQHILAELKVLCLAVDRQNPIKQIQYLAHSPLIDAIIIATPTETHEFFLDMFYTAKKPILCEKPITKDSKALEKILALYKKHKTPLTMTMQYTELIDKKSKGETYYDYFRTGKDGLYWDTMQIIALAKSSFKVSCRSPIWKCQINGKKLSLSNMDAAYLSFVKKWLAGEIKQDYKFLVKIHKKVEKCHDQLSRSLGLNSYPG